MADNNEVLAELAKLNERIDKLKKVLEGYMFMASEMQVGSMRAALRGV